MRLLLTLFLLWATASAARAEAPPAPIADLQSDPSLSTPLQPKDGELLSYLEDLNGKTGKAFVVLGDAISETALGSFRGKPAREFLAALADRLKSKWRRYEDFYLLYPSDLERHDAKPVRREEQWKELRRTVPGVYAGDLMDVLGKLGRETKVLLLAVGPNAGPRAQTRAFLPCALAARERTLDEVMRALTVLTGDPWGYWQDTHLLSFLGRQLSGEERRIVTSTIASVRFGQSLTAKQRQAIDAEGGLLYSDLSLGQQQDLASATVRMRARTGVAPETLVLGRTPRAPHLPPSPIVEVFIRTPAGLQPIGGIKMP